MAPLQAALITNSTFSRSDVQHPVAPESEGSHAELGVAVRVMVLPDDEASTSQPNP